MWYLFAVILQLAMIQTKQSSFINPTLKIKNWFFFFFDKSEDKNCYHERSVLHAIHQCYLMQVRLFFLCSFLLYIYIYIIFWFLKPWSYYQKSRGQKMNNNNTNNNKNSTHIIEKRKKKNSTNQIKNFQFAAPTSMKIFNTRYASRHEPKHP